VPRSVFVAGQPVAASLVRIPDQRLRNAPAIMGSPGIGPPPPAPVRVAAAVPARAHPLPSVAANTVKRTNWGSIVRSAMIRSHNFQQIARLRFAHLRVPGFAKVSRFRHTIVLRVARADRAPPHPETHKRVIRR
jgi:hypothetical protein